MKISTITDVKVQFIKVFEISWPIATQNQTRIIRGITEKIIEGVNTENDQQEISSVMREIVLNDHSC